MKHKYTLYELYDIPQIESMLDNGMSIRAIARALNVNEQTFHAHLKGKINRTHKIVEEDNNND